jgi:DNA ligase-1
MSIIFEDTTVVNGKAITTCTEVRDGVERKVFPDLYKVNKLGKVTFWRIYVVEDTYYRESGQIEGKVREFEGVRATPKNVGKANETTPHHQALFEAFSEWNHKKDQLYSEEYPVEDEEDAPSPPDRDTERARTTGDASARVQYGDGKKLRPMLAEKWTERKRDAKFPGAVSEKLDGVRVMCFENEEGVQLISRLGKLYKFLDGIREEAKVLFRKCPGVVLDGEIYSHNAPFNAISGAVRTSKKPSAFDELVEYHIFDLVLPGLSYQARMEKLRELMDSKGDRFKRLKIVDYELVNTPEQVKTKHDEYVAQGYEGLIFRNLDAPYLLGRRTSNLLKYKEFLDEEFKVVDVMEGKGTEKGAAVFVCVSKDGEKFNVRPRGSIEKRRVQYRHKAKYIGKQLTVRYQPLSNEDVLPRFPIGIKFADKKVEELVGVGLRDYE